MSEDFITAEELERQRKDRLAALDQVVGLFRGTDLPPMTDLLAMADWVLTGVPDVAQGNERISHQLYGQRREEDL